MQALYGNKSKKRLMIHFFVNVSKNNTPMGNSIQGAFSIPEDKHRTPRETALIILDECSKLYKIVNIDVEPKDIIIHVLTRIN
jgi:hypothetical protein